MSKLDDLKNEIIPVGVNNQHYDLVQKMIQGLYGLRAELFAQATTSIAVRDGIDRQYGAGHELIWTNEEGTPAHEKGKKLIQEYKEKMVDIEAQAMKWTDETIDSMLINQDNTRKLISNGITLTKDPLVDLVDFKGQYTTIKNNVETE